MINFNVPPNAENSLKYINTAISNQKISGDGEFSKKCCSWLEQQTNSKKSLLTTSCTHALEMSAILADINYGDEVIMPSYTFVSTANAFVLRGAKIVFVDIRPDTMNINETLIEAAITAKTKAIVPVHYAGVGCEMDTIINIAKKHNLYVIEDAAQAILSEYKGKQLGSFGELGCFSFHETKNFSSGEGGSLQINNESFIERAEITREKGTDRSKFFRGQVDKYTWVDIGSSYLLSELNAAYLYAQFEVATNIINHRMNAYNRYKEAFSVLEKNGDIQLPFVPSHCKHNAHMFYLKLENISVRTNLIEYLKKSQILSVFHYIPLHSSPAGNKFGYFFGEDVFTTKESERLLRLPLFNSISNDEIDFIIQRVLNFFK